MNRITKSSDISWYDEEETMISRNQTWAKMNTLEATSFNDNVCWTPPKSTAEISRLTVRGYSGGQKSIWKIRSPVSDFFCQAVVSSLKLTSLITKAFIFVEWDQNSKNFGQKAVFFLKGVVSVIRQEQPRRSQRHLRAAPKQPVFRSIRIFLRLVPLTCRYERHAELIFRYWRRVWGENQENIARKQWTPRFTFPLVTRHASFYL